MARDLYPETAEEAIRRWDAGEIVWTVEMGGLGPGYEQAIQVGVIELCRKLLASGVTAESIRQAEAEDNQVNDHRPEGQEKKYPKLNVIFDGPSHVIDRDCHLGLSGAQAGAIKNLVYRYLRDGWRATLEDAKAKCADRLTMVSKHWPGQPRT